jgi:hypothetical protein
MLLYDKKSLKNKSVKKAAEIKDPVYTDTYTDRLAKLAAYKPGRKGLEDYLKK